MTMMAWSDMHLCLHAVPSVLPVPLVHNISHRQSHRAHNITATRPRSVLAQPPRAVAGSLQQPATATSLPEAASGETQENMSPAQLRSLWDRVGKPLLRVGKGGVQASHVNSIRELLFSHTLIKVQINQHDQQQVTASGQQLASQANAQLLQVKGRTALFAQGNADLDSLRQSTSQQSSSEKQHLERVWHNADGVEVPIQLQPDVQAQLQFLNTAGVLLNDELDRKCLRVLSQMPQGPALTLLKGMNKTSMRAVRNKSAWVNSQCRRIMAQAR